MKIRRYVSLISLVLVLTVVRGSMHAPASLALGRTEVQRVMKSVVQIMAVDRGRDGRPVTKWGGSGTIISEDGLILTNCHVAYPRAMVDDPVWDYDALVIGVTTRSDEPPRFAYLAEVLQYDPRLDLAVIRVSHALDGTPLDPDELDLPAVSVGDSDELEIGDKLSILGYPGIGGETVTPTTGNVSGFSRERGVTGRAWIKTDATIAGGNSGGMSVDEKGMLVGVPTRAGVTDAASAVDCRPVADTNNDGVIDSDDNCVPIGGFINALRPVALARPLIEAAERGFQVQPKPTTAPSTKKATVGKPSVSRLIFATQPNEHDQPVTVVDSFPSGSEEIYLFFDYENFQDGASWQPALIYEGDDEADVWPVATWDGGSAGTWWISVSNDPLEDGTYEFVLAYDGEELGSVSVEVGGKAVDRPTMSNVVFTDGDEEGYLLPAGIDEIKAIFEYDNMTSSTKWSYSWYYDGKEVAGDDGQSFTRSTGEASLTLTNRTGFESGTYRLELEISGQLAATSDLFIAGEKKGDDPSGDRLFGPITFGSERDSKGKLLDPGTAFSDDITKLYGAFDYEGMEDGWEWGWRWSIDEEVVLDSTAEWDSGESGENYQIWINTRSGGALPAGEYRLELLLQEQLVQSGEVTVGKASAVPTPTTVPEGQLVEVYGKITDADTGKGLEGAIFLVLKPGISVSDFEVEADQVYSMGESDRTGHYELSPPLLRGETYSMMVGRKGYRVVAEDDITIAEDAEAELEVNIALQKAQ